MGVNAILDFSKTYLIAPGLLILIVLSQFLSDRVGVSGYFLPPFVPPSSVLRVADLGLHSAAASYMWLSAIQNFNLDQRTNYGSIGSYIRAINRLDPKFAYPYAFAALVMPEMGLMDEALEIADAGIRAVPDDWLIPYYTAIAYHMYKNDRISAVRFFDRVANLASAPPNIRSVATNYGSARTMREQSRAIWKSIYETSEDEIVLERAQKYLARYDILDGLDRATEIFTIRYGRHPGKIQDLVTFKIIRSIPEDPFGLVFKYDDSGHVRAEPLTRI